MGQIIRPLGEQIHAAADKTPPVDADQLPISDSAASFTVKSLTWADLKGTILTAASALYATLLGKAGGQTLNGGTAASETLTLACVMMAL